jgi:hypothetical protein
MHFKPSVWGPHYWFFLHTVSFCYPIHPNTVTKKKYYDFIQNFPLFIPRDEISIEFSKLLNEYPVTPYLDSRMAFIRWVHFIHNKINEKLKKPKISLKKFYESYYEQYVEKEKQDDFISIRKRDLYLIGFIVLTITLFVIY